MRFDLLERRANMTCLQMDFTSGDFVTEEGGFSLVRLWGFMTCMRTYNL